MNVPAKVTEISAGELIESVIVKGDLSKLDPGERAQFYVKVCQSVGLNPMTRPFEYITLNGKLTLYAKRDCADQLRQIHGISIQVVDQRLDGEMLTVHVRAEDKTGRKDEDFGVVSLPDGLKGEGRANAILKAITKAKRRVTLSISGLGLLDETEVSDIPGAAKRIGIARALPAAETVDPDTGEIVEDEFGSAPVAEKPAPVSTPDKPEAGTGAISMMDMAREAAQRGPEVLKAFFKARTPAEKKELRKIEADLIKLYPATEAV